MSLLLQLTSLADAPAEPGWLTDDERRRLDGMRDAARAAQFLAAHGLARTLAAELAGGEPAQWRWAVADDGRRRLDHPRHASLFTSVSHAGRLVVAAVGITPLGVDLEVAGRSRDWMALANTMFSPGEVAELAAAGEDEREAVFLASWTLKEAWSKRSGRGLQRSEARRCTASPSAAARADAWTWALADGGALALAASSAMPVTARGPKGEPRAWRYFEPGS